MAKHKFGSPLDERIGVQVQPPSSVHVLKVLYRSLKVRHKAAWALVSSNIETCDEKYSKHLPEDDRVSGGADEKVNATLCWLKMGCES